MKQIKNSPILNKLIDYSMTIGNKTVEMFSTERYILAVLDFIYGKFLIKNVDIEYLTKLCRVLFSACTDINKLQERLLAHINNNDNIADIEDGFYSTDKLLNLSLRAQNKKITVITPEMFLEDILNDPNDVIKEFVVLKKKVQSDEDYVSESDEICAILDHKFDQLFEEEKETDFQNEDNASKSEIYAEKNINHKKSIADLTEKVRHAREELLSQLYGQDNAVSVFTSGYFQGELSAITDKERIRPRATFLFAGPPGVGKTFLAEKAAGILKIPFMRFDMSEYSDREANIEFCGSDRVYKNGKAGNVTEFVENNPVSVLLFDEIEKANICVIHLFLQILDAGRLRDNFTDREVSFKDTIIIFTTNAGKQLYEQSESGDFSGFSRKVILKALQNDVNSETGVPFFPAAICSRFASGNVIMFNYIGAYNLREIAKHELIRHADNFEKETGISVVIDESVYTAILFTEGGSADARTIRSRSEMFFNTELFELLRLIASDKSAGNIEDIESIKIGVRLSPDDKQINSLFSISNSTDILMFSSERLADICRNSLSECNIYDSQSLESAVKLLHDNDIRFIIVDINYGCDRSFSGLLDAEDIESPAREFLRYIKDNCSDIPVFLLQTPENKLSGEEKVSFTKSGIRGIIDFDFNGNSFSHNILRICNEIHQQNSMEYLAKYNKIISFETSQTVTENGRTAIINLFDFKLRTAVDAEDSKNILSNVSKPDVNFEQIIGAEDAKKELAYFAEYLRNPKKYIGTGVRTPKGIILYGPPGTGKTMLAKAMACESGVTFISAQGNEFINKYVGEGINKVHELFKTARKYAPSVLFVDEIDSIAKERKGGENSSVNGEDVLTAFLTEMDGFKNDTSKPVFVLAATNYNIEQGTEKSLDDALVRRFDRKIYLDLPNKDERIRFIKTKIDNNKFFAVSHTEIDNIAVRSMGMSFAQLDSVAELAIRKVISDGGFKVTDSVLEEAFEEYNSGEIKKCNPALSERIARHEAGHAYLCFYSGETPSYITIVARGNHGGYMQHSDNEGNGIYTKDELLAKIRTALGGRAAEIVYYGKDDGISTGAAGDLASATELAQQIICRYGMDDDFGLAVIDSNFACNSELALNIRTAVNGILNEQMNYAVNIISEHREIIDVIVAELMLKNHITGNDFNDLIKKYTDKKN